MGSSAAGHSCLTNAQYAIRNTSEAKLGEASQLLYAPRTETLAYSRLSEPSPRTYEVESMAWAGIECPARANADRMQVRNKRLKIDLSHVLRAMLVPLWPLPNLARLISRPMRKCSVVVSRSKAANERANFAVSLPQRFMLEKALLALGPVAARFRWPIPAYPLVGEKVDASLHQENNYIKKKMDEAQVILLFPQFVNPSRLNSLCSWLFLRAGQDKGQPPLQRWAKYPSSKGLLTCLRSKLQKKILAPAEFNFTPTKW